MNAMLPLSVRISLAMTLFAALFAAYMLFYSRGIDVPADEGTMLMVTESIVKHGRFNIDQANNVQYIHPGALGSGGERYAKYGIGQSLAAAPLYALALAWPGLGIVDTVLLLSPLVTAMAAVVVMLTAVELGASKWEAVSIALLYGFCTMAWVYAKHFYSEPLAGLGFAIAGWGVSLLLTRLSAKGAALAGAGLGLAMLVKTSVLIAVPVLILIAFIWGGPRRLRLTLAATAPIALTMLVIGLYNWYRFHDPTNSGYGNEGFEVFPLIGVWGMLFSPGRSLFVYAPVILIALPRIWKIQKPAGLRWWVMGTSLGILILHGAWEAWWGAWSWGPRFLVPILPVLALGFLGVFDWKARQPRQRWLGLTTLIILSLIVEATGILVHRVLFYWYVMAQTGPGVNPDEVSIWNLNYFMPLINAQIALKGSLDLAWKPGPNAPLDISGLTLALTALLVGLIGLGLVIRGRGLRPVTAILFPVLVFGITLVNLTHYHQVDNNSYVALPALINSVTPPNAIIVMADTDPVSVENFWNINRSTRRFIGLPGDAYWVEYHTLPLLRQAVQQGVDIWYLQLSDMTESIHLKAADMSLCAQNYPTESSARLVHWTRCN